MSLRISVVTAVRNCAPTVGAALGSVHAQRWADLEHIVVDGGSTDGTLDVLEAHRPRIAKLISEPDDGLYHALNKGIREASGDVIGFMHADDQFATPDALARIAEAFADPRVGAAYGDLVYVRGKDGQHVARYWRAGGYDRDQLAHGWMPPHPTFYVRREVYARCGVFDTRFRIAADYENMLRILWTGNVQAAYIPEVLVRMRTGGMSGRWTNLLHKWREDYAAMQQNGIGGLNALLLKNMTKLPQFVLKTSAA